MAAADDFGDGYRRTGIVRRLTADRAGFERGVDGEEAHPAGIYASAISRTSGTKWRSRFSMPCFSVAVEDGQPAQEPRMLRKTTPSRKPRKVMSPPSWATAGRTRVSISSLMVATVSESSSREELLAALVLGLLAEDRHAGEEMLHDRAEDRRLEVLPLAVGLGDGDEIVAEEDAADARHGEQPLGERRTLRLAGGAVLGRAGCPARRGRAGTSATPDWGWFRSG